MSLREKTETRLHLPGGKTHIGQGVAKMRHLTDPGARDRLGFRYRGGRRTVADTARVEAAVTKCWPWPVEEVLGEAVRRTPPRQRTALLVAPPRGLPIGGCCGFL